MHKILYILLALLLFQGCSIFSKKIDNDIIDDPIEDYSSIDNDSLAHLNINNDSLLIPSIDSILIDSPVFDDDIFHLIPVQKEIRKSSTRYIIDMEIHKKYMNHKTFCYI